MKTSATATATLRAERDSTRCDSSGVYRSTNGKTVGTGRIVSFSRGELGRDGEKKEQPPQIATATATTEARKTFSGGFSSVS